MSLQNAVILKNIPAYLEVLSGFSQSVTRLWRYVRAEEALHVSAHPGSRAYRFFDASREVAFLHRMIQQAVEDEIPRELPWLSGYDKAFAQLEAEFDLPRKDLSALIRMAQSSQGRPLRGGESSISICLPRCWTVLKKWCGIRLGSRRRTALRQGTVSCFSTRVLRRPDAVRKLRVS